jgi:protein-S-isoprenylcysteine O-methyltransferase Ste14
MPEGSLIIIALFLAYFAIHSLTASLWMKRLVVERYPQLVPWYRLLFNFLSLLLAIPLLAALWWLALLAFIAFIYSLKMYDMAEFWGTRQLREQVHEVRDLEQFQISPFHRYVRHPWYFLLLVILWTRDITTTQLLCYSLITLYLFIGSRMEERKLIAYHGAVYERYRQRVAGIIPLPWKFLSRSEAERLLKEYRASNGDLNN